MTSAACTASNQISYVFSIFHRLAATRHLIQNTMSVCGVRREACNLWRRDALDRVRRNVPGMYRSLPHDLLAVQDALFLLLLRRCDHRCGCATRVGHENERRWRAARTNHGAPLSAPYMDTSDARASKIDIVRGYRRCWEGGGEEGCVSSTRSYNVET